MSAKKIVIKLMDCPAFCKPNCKIRDPDKVQRILNELINGGINKLQLVSDFDFTLTKQKLDNGDPVLSSFCIFDQCPSVPESFRIESNKLVEKYRPIEHDTNMSINEKTKYMIEWWTKSSEALRGFSVQPDEIDNVTAKYSHALRDGTNELLQELNLHNVPVLVFSAGLGDCVKSVLRNANMLLPNIKIISNFLEYKDGLLNGFNTEKMIHIFNKNETALVGTDYYDLVHDRDHIIIMGDSLGDANMANGVPTTSHILKIGFLFVNIEQNLPVYMDTFDIVLVDDQTMDIPRSILSLILQKD